jgi:hypothetical protein
VSGNFGLSRKPPNPSSFQERSFSHSAIFQVLDFNSPAVCHQFSGHVPPESRDCRSTFSNPNPTPNTIARNVFTAPWHSLKLPTTFSNSFKIRCLRHSSPKVAGSNPAPATNQINNLRSNGRSDKLPKTPNKENCVSGARRYGMSTISTTLLLACRLVEIIACP